MVAAFINWHPLQGWVQTLQQQCVVYVAARCLFGLVTRPSQQYHSYQKISSHDDKTPSDSSDTVCFSTVSTVCKGATPDRHAQSLSKQPGSPSPLAA